jgi:hypothetical protein
LSLRAHFGCLPGRIQGGLSAKPAQGENPGPERAVVCARTNAAGALDYHAPAAPVSVTPVLWAERE